MIRFFVPGIPATKGSWKVMRNKLRPDNAREKPWALAVAWSAKAAGIKPTTAPVHVEIKCFFPRPKKPTHPFPSRNDVDKLARSTLDALTSIAWADDQQVVSLVVTKAYADADVGAAVAIMALASDARPNFEGARTEPSDQYGALTQIPGDDQQPLAATQRTGTELGGEG